VLWIHSLLKRHNSKVQVPAPKGESKLVKGLSHTAPIGFGFFLGLGFRSIISLAKLGTIAPCQCC
jgi:hypothetical protein